MSIYGVGGSDLASVYNVGGDALENAFDVYGNSVFDGSKYKIDNVISYYREPTLSVASEINSLSDDWQSFVYITDPHGSGNKQHSQAIALYMLDNTPASFVVLGGDYINGFAISQNYAEYRKYVSPFLNSGLMDNIYAVMGNHEYKNFSDATVDVYDDVVTILHDDFFNKSNLSGDLGNCYGYFDDVTNKTRFILLNTADHTPVGISSDQLSWLEQSVILPDSSWSLLVIGHVPISDMGMGIWVGNLKTVKDYIKKCSGSVIGYLCGHEHCDYFYHNGDFEEVTMICDRFENIDYFPGVSVTDRVAGTVSEQAVSVFSFNTKTKQVVIRRIGAGRNPTMSYSYA